MKKVLLHICCGICASYPVEKLKSEGFEVIGYFYNPNIQPKEEYLKRQEVAASVARLLAYEFIPGAYDEGYWMEAVKGLENEPEGGVRCAACFKIRLEAAFRKAKELGADCFTTTLSVSPHKDAGLINKIGKSISPESFLEYDFKKNNGFKISMEFARNNLLYKQNYCGCLFGRSKTD
ncbi:MAG: epoxyqueuosine reductase QueH [Candidatus Omnitrophica bacterium]|nr:epoxyqueuosine reductase QueH [Candidatus Omnitrophota bacterium]